MKQPYAAAYRTAGRTVRGVPYASFLNEAVAVLNEPRGLAQFEGRDEGFICLDGSSVFSREHQAVLLPFGARS